MSASWQQHRGDVRYTTQSKPHHYRRLPALARPIAKIQPVPSGVSSGQEPVDAESSEAALCGDEVAPSFSRLSQEQLNRSDTEARDPETVLHSRVGPVQLGDRSELSVAKRKRKKKTRVLRPSDQPMDGANSPRRVLSGGSTRTASDVQMVADKRTPATVPPLDLSALESARSPKSSFQEA